MEFRYLKYTITCVLLSFLILVHSEECVYGPDGLCMESCPPGTVSYSPSCQEEVMTQRTCASPVARSMGRGLCDLSRCDCPEDQVWDEAAKQCVSLADCSAQAGNDGRV